MTRKLALVAATLPALALLPACGNNLEDRQAAADEMGANERFPEEDEITITRVEPTAPASEAAAEPEAVDADDDSENEGDGEELVVDAAPDDLIDSAQGFAPEPMDDTQGFDPTPTAPESFDD